MKQVKKLTSAEQRKKLIDELDETMSKMVIARDKKCVICGSKEKLTWGHLFSKRTYATRWDQLNSHCQCWPCNYGHVYDTSKYTKWFLDTYGQDAWNALYDRFHSRRQWTMADMKAMLSDFQGQLER